MLIQAGGVDDGRPGKGFQAMAPLGKDINVRGTLKGSAMRAFFTMHSILKEAHVWRSFSAQVMYCKIAPFDDKTIGWWLTSFQLSPISWNNEKHSLRIEAFIPNRCNAPWPGTPFGPQPNGLQPHSRNHQWAGRNWGQCGKNPISNSIWRTVQEPEEEEKKNKREWEKRSHQLFSGLLVLLQCISEQYPTFQYSTDWDFFFEPPRK